MDNFDLKNYLTEGKIYENKSFSSNGYQIYSVEPTSLELGRGFLPLQFKDFKDDVNSNDYDSVHNFIQNSIYDTFSDSIDSIYDIKREAFMKNLKKDREKLEDDWKNDKISEEEYDKIDSKLDREENDFNAIDPHELVILDMDDDGGNYKIFHPITNVKLISGEFSIF